MAAVLMGALLVLLAGAGSAEALHRAADRAATSQESPAPLPAGPIDADGCAQPAERRRAPEAAADRPCRVVPLPPRRCGPVDAPADGRQDDRAVPGPAPGRGVVLRC
ncbi:hypothetical protein ACWGB8_29900 [Kitasatospora sp. NPDC054939]